MNLHFVACYLIKKRPYNCLILTRKIASGLIFLQNIFHTTQIRKGGKFKSRLVSYSYLLCSDLNSTIEFFKSKTLSQGALLYKTEKDFVVNITLTRTLEHFSYKTKELFRNPPIMSHLISINLHDPGILMYLLHF